MTGNEDCASVLEQFMHDVANLPAEISHMMEEIQAKEKDMQQHLSSINAKDAAIQKQIKLSGSMVPHAKEKEFSESILKSYDVIQELQEQKIAMSDKASLLLERQLKKLDVRIREQTQLSRNTYAEQSSTADSLSQRYECKHEHASHEQPASCSSTYCAACTTSSIANSCGTSSFICSTDSGGHVTASAATPA
jgi:L-fucose isomerase-like protein